MRIVVAEDDVISLKMLTGVLDDWGYEVLAATNGAEALQILESDEAPRLAILDWMMPEVDGIEICRRLRQRSTATPVHTIILTARTSKEDLVEGLQAGANDFIRKPFDPQELRARIHVGQTVTRLQQALADRVNQLESALGQVRKLKQLLPFCSYCQKIRDENHDWRHLESYLREHAEVKFSHGVCPDCIPHVLEREMRLG